MKNTPNVLVMLLLLGCGVILGILIPRADANRRGVTAAGWQCPDAQTCFFWAGESFFVMERSGRKSADWKVDEVRQPPPSRYSKPSKVLPLGQVLK